jgi:phosphate-induced protein 1
MKFVVLLGCAAIATGCVGGADDAVSDSTEALQGVDVRPDGKGGGLAVEIDARSGGRKPSGPAPITYHGGPVMLGTTNVYYIWYGNWDANPALQILPDLAAQLGGSPYFNINTTYTDGAGNAVSNSLAYGGSTSVGYPQGTRLNDGNIQSVVASVLTAATPALPTDPNGIYLVLTSSDVSERGFCTSFCGWHTHATINGADVKYGFIGSPDRCPSSCEQQTASSPNGDPAADGMASVISHEIEESVTDPDINAWYDKNGQENADKCAWTFGDTYTVANGSLANMTLGARDFLIQRNWVNDGAGYCALSYTTPPPP